VATKKNEKTPPGNSFLKGEKKWIRGCSSDGTMEHGGKKNMRVKTPVLSGTKNERRFFNGSVNGGRRVAEKGKASNQEKKKESPLEETAIYGNQSEEGAAQVTDHLS